ncbi:glutaredoxin family protein [Texcoconibacillus texcoconensis]|uniref:Glutaredoxin n=1 Tax=Texcoconibacillus texcoconensis TaxID=1095777 RepID=A0A840QQ42_9BACI|nr:glutaredoxin family protein [Texcoconibacillus texcoconensis]MBB5173458.1 glutaredoxin [Texcoconibacillus texcoconensis]
MKLTFYTKEQCPLCAKGLIALERVQKHFDFQIDIVDIYEDDELLERYQIRIPVVVAEDGQLIDEGILQEETVLKNLRQLFMES